MDPNDSGNNYDLPFYSWQCISLRMNHRDVDFVIKNERSQNKLVKYLLYKLQTIDGRAGSAKKLIQMMDDRELSLYKNSEKYIENREILGDEIPKTLQIKIRLKNRLLVLR